MTNEQLFVLLKTIGDSLKKAVDEADDLLLSSSNELDRHTERVYKGNNPVPAFDFKNWVNEPTGRAIALDPIVGVLDQLSEHLAVLNPPLQIDADNLGVRK